MPKITIPIKVNDVDIAFGGRDVEKLMPDYDDIPEEFKDWNRHGKWQTIIETWFYKGLSGDTIFKNKTGINAEDALKHINCIMRSWKPKHEHKIAACSYLLSLWFDDVIIPEKERNKT